MSMYNIMHSKAASFSVSVLVISTSILIFIFTGESLVLISCGTILCAYSVFLARFFLPDPRAWLAVFGYLYAFAVPIMNEIEGYPVYNDYMLNIILFTGYSSLIVALFLFGRSVDTEVSNPGSLERGIRSALPVVSSVLLFLFSALSLLNVFIFLLDGSQTKRGFEGHPLYFGFYYNYMIVFYVSFIALSGKTYKTLFFSAVVGSISFLSMSLTGERDVILKFIMVITMTSLLYGWISIKTSIIISISVVLMLPLLKPLMSLMYGSWSGLRAEGIIGNIMYSDFIAAGRNLDYLLLRPDVYHGQGLSRFFADVARGIIPGQFFLVENTGTWFSNVYTPIAINRSQGGLGFTLVGSFYIYGGLLGVAIGFALLGIFVSVMYKYVKRSEIILILYVTMAPLLIWSLRGDLGYVLSSLTKQGLLPIFTLVGAAVLCRLAVGKDVKT